MVQRAQARRRLLPALRVAQAVAQDVAQVRVAVEDLLDGRNREVDICRSLSQRNQMAREKNERMLEQHGAKLSVAEQAHADTRRAWTALEAERSHHCRQLEDNDSIVRELRDKLLRGKMEHEAEVASVQQQQQQLAAQVRAYHQDLRTAMKAVSTSNAVLVA